MDAFKGKIIYWLHNDFNRDVMVTGMGQMVVMLLLFIMNKYLSTVLRPEAYTVFLIANKSAAVIAFLMIFCLGIAIPRYLPKYLSCNAKVQGESFIRASLLCLMFMSTAILAMGSMYSEELSTWIFAGVGSNYLVIGMLLYAAGIAYSNFLYAFFRGEDDFYSYGISQIVIQCVLLVGAVGCFYDLPYMLSVWGVSMVVISILWFSRGYHRLFQHYISACPMQQIKVCVREILIFCFPRLPGDLIWFSFIAVPLILLNHKLGTEGATGFGVALMVNSMLTPFFSLVGTVLLPYVSRKMSSREGGRDIFNRIRGLLILYIITSVGMSISIFAFAEYILCFLFSSEYMQYAAMVRYMSLAIFPNAIYLLFRNPLDAVSRFPFNTINLGISFIVLNMVLWYGNSITVYIGGFLAAYFLLGILSWASWKYCFNRRNNLF